MTDHVETLEQLRELLLQAAEIEADRKWWPECSIALERAAALRAMLEKNKSLEESIDLNDKWAAEMVTKCERLEEEKETLRSQWRDSLMIDRGMLEAKIDAALGVVMKRWGPNPNAPAVRDLVKALQAQPEVKP